MRLINRTTAAACLAGAMFIPTALALPPATDRVPANAAMMIVVPSLERFEAGATQLQQTFGMEMDSGPFEGLAMAMGLEGLNKAGSAALAIIPGPEGVDFDSEVPPMVLVVPVTDYAKFVGALGGDPGAQVAEITIDPEEPKGYARNLGGGFAAMGPVRELVEGFKGETGQNAGHDRLIGATGKAVAESADVIFIANLALLEPKMREGMEEFRGQMEMVGMMAGQDMGANLAVMDAVMGGILRDGQAGVIGFSATEAGMKLDLAAQFKEGSTAAGYFSAKGNTSGLLTRVPNQPVLFALALDTSAPGIKRIFRDMTDITTKLDPEAAEAAGMTAAMMKSIEKMDGMVFQWGASPAMMGGMFVNALAYVKTTDAAGYTAAMKETMAAMNGKTIQGLTYQTSYKSAARDVGGVKADEWSLRMQADPNDPTAQQMQAMQMGLFGMEGGPSGYLAPAKDGLVMTYSKNSALLEQALTAAKGSGGYGAEAGVKTVGAMLPGGRTVEGYIGVKSILDMVIGFAAMMGGGPVDMQVPADLPPVGIGGTTDGGGVRLAVFVPGQVIQTFKQFVEQMEGGGDDMAPPEKAGQPRFE